MLFRSEDGEYLRSCFRDTYQEAWHTGDDFENYRDLSELAVAYELYDDMTSYSFSAQRV